MGSFAGRRVHFTISKYCLEDYGIRMSHGGFILRWLCRKKHLKSCFYNSTGNRIVSTPLQMSFQSTSCQHCSAHDLLFIISGKKGVEKQKGQASLCDLGLVVMIAPKFLSRVRVFQMCIQNSQRCSFVKEKFNHRQPVADVADDKRNNAVRGWSNFRCLVKSPSRPEFLRQNKIFKRPQRNGIMVRVKMAFTFKILL